MTVIAVLVSHPPRWSGRRCFSDGGGQSGLLAEWALNSIAGPSASVLAGVRMPGGWSGAARSSVFIHCRWPWSYELPGGLLFIAC